MQLRQDLNVIEFLGGHGLLLNKKNCVFLLSEKIQAATWKTKITEYEIVSCSQTFIVPIQTDKQMNFCN